MVIPEVSALPDVIKEKTEADLKYYSLDNPAYFWETGNAPLPAANEQMIEFFKQNFHYVPYRYAKGFYMKKENE